MRLQFGLEAFEHRSRSIASQRIINCYLEKAPLNASNPIALVGAYGIEDFATPGTGPLRGGKTINGVPYVVSGAALYRINQNGSSTLLGSIPGTGYVGIAGDGLHVGVVSHQSLYVWNGSSVAEVSTFPGGDTLDWLSTYFTTTKDGQVFVSASNDPTSWNALDFLSAEASPDDIVGQIVEKGVLFAGGLDTLQAFYVSDSDVPLDRIPEGIAEIGLLSRFGMAKIDNSIFFPARDFTVRRLDGYRPVVISTPAISQAIEDLSSDEKSQLRGLCWSESGHNFYGLSCARWTYVYDASTQLWSQRKSHGVDYWRGLFVITAYDKLLVGDRDSNKVGTFSPNVYTEWGEPMTMLGTCHAVDPDYVATFVPELELVFDRGEGTSTGQGANPMVMMRQSFDGGKTWTDERWRGMGKVGEYGARATWSRMGRARDRVIEFSISDPVRRALSYAKLRDPEVGAS
jgi:hypothetical protein